MSIPQQLESLDHGPTKANHCIQGGGRDTMPCVSQSNNFGSIFSAPPPRCQVSHSLLKVFIPSRYLFQAVFQACLADFLLRA